ncbi:hypothetical protein TEA_006776 [Camellia sinensis var. sinensis]|uniref:Uncharacterized protein n=1 Tax=Camellia sinensis var. sinensis TaxID=542762 RepID=A0A4S4D6V9_CAMSN|nr:hypothetical protein TEA_006776 [Camellia sinensis var. sinensis]
MCKCRSHGTFPLFGLQSSHFEYLLLPPRSALTAARAQARAQGFAATAALSYSSGLGACPDGQNSRPGSSYPEGNFGGNQLLDGSISLSPLYPSQTNDLHACSHSNPSQKIKVGRWCNPRGDPVSQLPCALRVLSPVDSYTCQTPWSVFQDGQNWELAGRRRECTDAEARPRARAASHDRGEGVSAGFLTARALASAPIRTGPRPESIGGPAGRRSTSDRGASLAPIRFPLDNFKYSLTLFSKSFSSFPRSTCLLSVPRPYLALDEIYRPIRATFPNNPTHGQRLVVRQGLSTTGLLPSPAPLSRGLGPGPPVYPHRAPNPRARV